MSDQIRALIAALCNRWPFTQVEYDAMDLWRDDLKALADGLDAEWLECFARSVHDLIADPSQYGRPNAARIQRRMEAFMGKPLHGREWKADPVVTDDSRSGASALLRAWRASKFGAGATQ